MPVTGSLYRGNPCADCQPPKRRTGCHGECPEYKEWSDTVKERKDLYWKDKKERTMFNNMETKRERFQTKRRKAK